MKNFLRNKFILFFTILLFLFTACDNRETAEETSSQEEVPESSSDSFLPSSTSSIPHTREKKPSSGKKHDGGEPEKKDGAENAENAEKKERSGNIENAERTENSERTGKPVQGESSGKSAENTLSGKGRGSQRKTVSGKRRNTEVPRGWIVRTKKKTFSQGEQNIWENIMEAVSRLIVTGTVVYAPAGTAGTHLELQSAGQYRFSGRCIVIERSGNRIPYSFEGTATANHYEAAIENIKFRIPGE